MKMNQSNRASVLKKIGISALNKMQLESLEAQQKHDNIVLLSPTGSGKTLAFLLPLPEYLKNDFNGVQVLIITPTRELAQQTESVFKSLGTGMKANSCYGGHPMRIEKNNFTLPPAVLAGTPGRIAEHLRLGNFSASSIHTLILDEFDKSLELGFHQEMSFIISQLGNVKKRILCSATDIAEIPSFTGINSPFRLDFLAKGTETENLSVKIVRSEQKDKLDCLFQLLCNLETATTLIFCNHRESVERISKHLFQAGIVNDYFHGGLEQAERERMLVRFRNGSSNILITTDLASRGLDIPDISYIIHYQLPLTEEGYIHRNGRTARMHANGSAFLVLSEDENVPGFVSDGYTNMILKKGLNIPGKPDWETLYLGGGKKDKISKMDIAGFLFKQGGLVKDELGYIDVKDHCSYAAIKRGKIVSVLQKARNQKIKNKKLKIEISR